MMLWRKDWGAEMNGLPNEVPLPADEDYQNHMSVRSEAISAGSIKASISWQDIPEFAQGYIECAFWTADPAPGSGEYSLDIEDWDSLTPDDQQSMIDAAMEFRNDDEVKPLLDKAVSCEFKGRGSWHDYTEQQAGHDYYLTRHGHGTGYWDRKFRVFIGMPCRDYAMETELPDQLSQAAKETGEAELYFFCVNSGDCNGPGNCEECDARAGAFSL